MKTLLTLVAVLAVLVTPLSMSADEPSKVYGTPSPDTIRVSVSNQFKESGTHYIPKGTKFEDFLKTIHQQDEFEHRPAKTVHVIRNGKRVCESYSEDMRGFLKQDKEKFEKFVLEDGDSLGFTEYPV